ncbi:uncharacterized protein LOC114293550 [Camellia sinensis]|uniref:uncharacterized protein LOC114293550 n=1 Tax=Camellia sinensis TaxID=4442 RepID=UPI001036BA9F|nr:uncharacterized protein LOC114293550 [Camellia sinensis]
MTDPCLVTGDFNDFSTSNEKRSFTGNQNLSLSQDHRRSRKFNKRMSNCKLMDLGCTRPRLTWSNNRKGWANTMVRLDRAMCNTEWRTSFPDRAVCNLPRTYSDHSPMMVFTQGRLKLYTDGSRRVGGDGGFGGLIRDERGTWVCGYYGKLHSGTSLEAELWAVYKGLTIILQK